jgi:nicotinamidase-related amidase
MKPALLILDPQNDFFGDDNPNLAEFQAAVPTINAAIALFRQRGWPVVFVQHSSSSKPAGSYAWAIHEQFDCRPDDTRLSKRHYNAFWETELDALLQSGRVDFVVVAGYVAEFCVLSTVRGALERGYRSAILADGIAGMNGRYTQFALELSPRITLAELETFPQ